MCGYVLSNAPPCPEMADVADSDIMVDVLMSWVALDVVGRWLHRISPVPSVLHSVHSNVMAIMWYSARRGVE